MDKELKRIQQKKWGTQSKSYLGIFVSGAKNDKTSLCELQYYPKYNKLVLEDLQGKIGDSADALSDENLVNLIKERKSTKKVGVNVSTQMPPCLRCKLNCPGVTKCRVEEVVWLKKQYELVKKKNKKAKMAMPYTDRPVEYYINHFSEKHIENQYSLSANAAPLTARMFFLKKHLKKDVLEVHPGLSIWRIGNFLKVQKSYLKYYRNSDDCEVIRLFFLDKLNEVFPIFMYQQDKQMLVANPNAFDAFLCALSVFCEDQKACEPKPKDFPKKAEWMCIPKKDLSKVFVK